MPTIRANDLEIGYDVVGTGPPLVMLHAATSTGRDTFRAQIPTLAASFTLYLPDARGHGRTRWDVADGFRADWLVDDVVAFVDALGLETFHLLGYSMGGMTALGMATRAPERLRTLVVIGIATARATTGERRAPADGSRSDPPQRPGLGGGPRPSARPRPGRRRCGSACSRRSPTTSPASRSSPPATCAGSRPRPWSRAATAIRSCRSARPPTLRVRSAMGDCSWHRVPATMSCATGPIS